MPILGYWKIRGLAANIRLQMAHSGVEYEMVEYEQGDGPEFDRTCWTDVKPTLGLDFPNLPYFIDGDFKMTETAAIHKYIADKWEPALLGLDYTHRAKVNMCAGVLADLKGAVTMPCYMQGEKEPMIAAMRTKLPAIVAFLGNNKFLTGDNVTWIDFYFYELCQLMKFLNPELFTEFPTLSAFETAVSSLPKVAAYLANPDCIDHHRIFNNKSAKVNSTL